jgi:hypothetical protein
MQPFSDNFEVTSDRVLKSYEKNIIFWILEKIFKSANYDEINYSFKDSICLHVGDGLSCKVFINGEFKFYFHTKHILQEYFINNDFIFDLQEIFGRSYILPDEYDFIEKLLFDMAFIIDETKKDRIKHILRFKKDDIKRISRLVHPLGCMNSHCESAIDAIRKNCLNIDAFGIFMRKVSRHFEETLTDEDRKNYNFKWPSGNFDFLINTFNLNYDTNRNEMQKYHVTYSFPQLLREIPLIDFDSNDIIVHSYANQNSLCYVYEQFKTALLKYFNISAKYIAESDFEKIWNTYLNINEWDLFCRVNKINQKDFNFQRCVVMFDPIKENFQIDFKSIIEKAINDEKENNFINFELTTTVDSYNDIIAKMELTYDDHHVMRYPGVYQDHVRICKAIESNIRRFTIGDVIDHWMPIHKKHVELSGKENNFSFSKMLSD